MRAAFLYVAKPFLKKYKDFFRIAVFIIGEESVGHVEHVKLDFFEEI